MAITHPLTAPAIVAARARFRPAMAVGISRSPFSYAQKAYAQQGQMLAVDVELPPLARADAEEVVAFGLAVNGPENPFLMPPPGNSDGVRGTWTGTPAVNGAHAVGVTSVEIDGLDLGATVKRGDWFQVGTGSDTHLHKLTMDGTVAGSPPGVLLEIFPRLRAALANDAAITIANPVGQWRLAAAIEWDIEVAMIYGVRFSCFEAI